MSNLLIRKAAVLGAGVMGAQIAAHLVGCGIPVILFDLAAKQGDPSSTAKKAVDMLKKLDPSPLAARDLTGWIEPANYDADVSRLAECDLIIEAIAERIDWKRELYARIAPHLRVDAILASNTSGLSINLLAGELPEAVRSRFCGVHFFNPPRYMHLVELIPAQATSPTLVDDLEAFLTTGLGKSVIRAFDTPNFVANRVGTFAFVAVMQHTERLGLSFDEVDALTGPLIGRPKSATYRLLDVIGLDTFASVLRKLPELLADDPWRNCFKVPAWLEVLVEKGAFGQKSRGGIYRKEGKEILVLDLAAQSHRSVAATSVDPEVEAILKLKDPAERMLWLRASAHPQAAFLWAIQRDLFHYCAVHLEKVASSARDIDLAMRWGYGWQQGPFESWQEAGWQAVAGAIAEDIAAGRTLSDVALPAWVFDGRTGVHGASGSYSAASGSPLATSKLGVYQRQLYPQRLLGEAAEAPGTTLFENAGVRLWCHDDARDIPILSLKSKGGTLGPEVVDGALEALRIAEREHRGLVIWQPKAPFSYGADLKSLQPTLQAQDWAALDAVLRRFQELTKAIKYAQVPVVAAIRGMALGGGCELVMHCARVVAAMETQPGLVEVGVGLIPAGGGCKEFAVRASRQAEAAMHKDILPFIQSAFQTVFMATIGKSAIDAQQRGYLDAADIVVPHADEILHVALAQARVLATSAWRPPLPVRNIAVAGRAGLALLQTNLLRLP
ncbi:3-hydroxyacyl-CoA dehydrogenase/enoyl-CoA hydratase family protein [Sulfuritalea sp.]|uniref:3-hydroxyacyl-CoA dehydrogenase/enoyl-CoA hydratase family protein n=1 Tax=Sulfuritalea sp. TaxID=2480090 RepID=UPI001AC2D25C|nr:3-hydroxyacyl-CoA dehydrogenase/enoyl-CoA hydratase family protein [Sulfuritalea sp.]MBN8476311.1 3-hydroxyacyl-CoA dehydrogenase/enoyl-CoA hydratase family protein [Sulfuritalea sp.]